MLVELYKQQDSINENNKSKIDILFKSKKILIKSEKECFKFKNLNEDTYIVLGKIFGFYDGLNLTKFQNKTQIKNFIFKHHIENLKKNMEGRYLLLKITKDNDFYLCADQYGKMDKGVYFRR